MTDTLTVHQFPLLQKPSLPPPPSTVFVSFLPSASFIIYILIFLEESPMGGALLALIGGIYKDRARSEMSSMHGYGIAVRQSGA